MQTVQGILKYLDSFGMKHHFYIDKRPRYYSVIGGILSIICFLLSLYIFVLAALKRLNPSTTTTILFNSNIKFEKEKLWFPWKLANNNNKYINYSNLIIYYSTIDNSNKKIKIINYQLCNETTLININKKTNNNKTNLPSIIDLYCIDLGEIIDNNFFISTNIIFNLIIPKENNNNESSLLKNNSLSLELFYPIVDYEYNNEREPLLNVYQKHSIIFKENTLKTDKITLQEFSVIDKFGFFREKEKLISLWGINSINAENISIDNNKDKIIPFYSLNISLDIKKIMYKRYHKNLMTIIIEIFPICYIIYKIFKYILYPFILAENNADIFEFLFEKVVEKENKSELFIKKMRFKSLGGANLKIKEDNVNDIIDKEMSNINHKIKSNKNNIRILNYVGSHKKNKNDCELNNNENNKDLNDFIKNSQKSIKFPIKLRNRSRHSVDYGTHNISQKNNNLFLINQNILINKNYDGHSNQLNGSKLGILPNDDLSRCSRYKYKLKRIKLFPYKYYFFSIFLKNYEIINCNYLFSLKYKKVFNFINQILDINSYLLLKKEFEIMKHIYCNEEDLASVEKNTKININSTKFSRDIKDCLDKNKFYILYQK